jgi:raffinose/stachyose/melibiose transport system substrate-binding protein
VMVYYNADLFEEHGVQVPTTLDELEAAMQTFVDAGITPLAYSGSEYPGQQVWYSLALSQADRQLVDAFQLYEGEVDFQNDAFTYRAHRLLEWVDAGYISLDANGLPAEDMGTSFIGGDHPMMLSGSWWYGRMIDEIQDFEWSTFLFPGSSMFPGSGGNIWVVPEGAANKDLAYKFIEITMREEIQNLLGNSGGVPVAADPDAITDAKNQELVDNFNAIADADGLAFYPDWPVPGFYDDLVAAIQELINQSASPADVLEQLQMAYDAGVADVAN